MLRCKHENYELLSFYHKENHDIVRHMFRCKKCRAQYNSEIMQLLLDKGVKLDLTDLTDVNGDTVLLVATNYDDHEIMRLLLKKGAKPDAINNRDQSTPLIRSAYKNNIDSVRLLLEAGANPDSVDKYGDTALAVAANKNNFAMVQLLLEKGANPQVGKNGNTALTTAKSLGSNAEIISLLQKTIDKAQKSEI